MSQICKYRKLWAGSDSRAPSGQHLSTTIEHLQWVAHQGTRAWTSVGAQVVGRRVKLLYMVVERV